LLTRYGTNKSGKRVRLAKIYTPEEHGIHRSRIDRDALKITQRLQYQGYAAYIVGGAIRDLLLGKVPKDFDIVTNALPRKARKIFRNSRIIGKRFRLVHVYFKEKIIEVATFRAGSSGADANEYGTIEEDVWRRDFSLNGLYFDPRTEQIIDFVEGIRDIRVKKIRSLIPPDRSFSEDSVRMIRAVKYRALSGFSMVRFLRRKIIQYSSRLDGCSSSRMTEEIFKILQSGKSVRIIRDLMELELFHYMLPRISSNLDESPVLRKIFFKQLEELDDMVRSGGEDRRSIMIIHLVDPFLIFQQANLSQDQMVKEYFKDIKELIYPITPPNKDVEEAVRKIFMDRGIVIKPSKRRKRKHPHYHGHRKPAKKRRIAPVDFD
jgi:poly(A) polymerase